MKKTSILLLGAIALLSSCGMIAQSASSDDGSRFQDGIYNSSPSFRSKEEKAEAKSKTDDLLAQTKESPIYLFGDKKDTIMIPENFSAKIQYDQKVGGTIVTVGENPYDWRWDLENNYGYYYGPYSIGSSWYWSRHYNPYWSSFYSPYYSPYWSSYYSPYWGAWGYDPWYYGGYWGWHDPWYHYHHCGWYDPYYHHHHHHSGPSYIAGGSSISKNTYHGLRARTEGSGWAAAGSSATTVKTSSSVRVTNGTVRGGMSVGNRTSRASSSVSRSSSSSRSSSTRSTSSPTYRRPSAGSSSSSGYTRGSSTSQSRSYGSSSSSDYNRSSSYSRDNSYNRSSSSSGSSYSRSSSYSGSSSGYSRGSSSSGGGYSRGGSSSSGGYRR